MKQFFIFFGVWGCLEAGWDLEAVILEAGRGGSWKMGGRRLEHGRPEFEDRGLRWWLARVLAARGEDIQEGGIPGNS